MKQKKKILHITPHLGGGVGSVVFNYIKNDVHFSHQIICLDYANENALKTGSEIGIKIYSNLSKQPEKIFNLIKDADAVLVHYWNHPLLYDFIIKNPLPPCRLAFWSHTSGSCPPHNFTDKLLKFPEQFIFNTPLAFDNPEVESLNEDIRNKIKVIWATGNMEKLFESQPTKKDYFHVGYIGTVDYNRLRKDYLELCKKINIPNIKFTVCGGLKEKELEQQAKEMGLDKIITFTGKITDVKKYLESFDVFAYPLVSNHSGTCDLVLQEAQSAGVVTVVFDNPMEKHIVQNNQTGFVVKTPEEYIQAIETLYHNLPLREKLSQQAKEYATESFSTKTLVEEWGNVFDNLLELPKIPKKWPINTSKNKIEPKDIFLEALGNYAKPFKLSLDEKTRQEGINEIQELAKLQIWQGKSKSTVHQYLGFFPEDKILQEWSEIMLSCEKNS